MGIVQKKTKKLNFYFFIIKVLEKEKYFVKIIKCLLLVRLEKTYSYKFF